MRNHTARIAMILILVLGLSGCAQPAPVNDLTVSLTNVSYDPTREFYTAYNNLFFLHWQKETGQFVEVTQSHGGSGSQAMSVTH